jgi:hypothetical protein
VTLPANCFKLAKQNDGTYILSRAGEVIEEGTNLSATNFNNLESGVMDVSIANAILTFGFLQHQRDYDAFKALMQAEVLGETKEITLTNTQKYPFNSTMDSPVSIALATVRKNLYYTVEVEVGESTGDIGNVHIVDKALNGFKIYFDGSASSVKLVLRIKGGMT